MKILKILTEKRKIGDFGEKAAAKYLRKNRYRILEKNYVSGNAEIDIIACTKEVTAFVEVKTRNIKSLGTKQDRPASAVTPEKQRKIINAASHYINRHKPNTRLSLDIIEVYIEDDSKRGVKVSEIKHIKSAFNLNTAFDSKYAYKRSKEGSNL